MYILTQFRKKCGHVDKDKLSHIGNNCNVLHYVLNSACLAC